MKTILVVEDNPLNRELMEAILDFNGFARLSVEDGLLGYELAKSELPDLVLMDIQMPVIDGYQSMQMLRAEETTAHIPIVAVTGNATSADRAKMIAEGFDDVIVKPFLIDDVLNIVNRLLA